MQIWAESGKSALPICNYSQILYQFLTFTQNLKRSLSKSNINSVLILVIVSKMYFHSISPFFVKVMSSSGNVWVANRIQHICNTVIHKFPIYGLFLF